MATLTEETVEDALREFDGNMAAVGRKFGVSRQGVWDFVQHHQVLQQVVLEVKETFIDDIEGALYRGAKEGNTTAQIFILKTQGRARGYVERVENTGADGQPIEIVVKHVERPAKTD
jgi:hypothetical protein